MRRKGVKQHDIRDCGAACLATISLRFGLKIPLVNIREMMKVDKNGSSLYAITETAKQLHLQAEALSGNIEELKAAIDSGEIRLPIIAHVVIDDSLAHYIVIDQLKEKKVVIFDPAKGHDTYSIEEFDNLWTGYIVSFEIAEGFKAENLKRGSLRKFFRIITEQKSFFGLILIFSLFLAGVSVISSLVYQRVIDQYILGGYSAAASGSNIPLFSQIIDQLNFLAANINSLFIALIGIYLVQLVIFLVRGFFLARISKKSSEILMYSYFSHILHLPVSFFQDRETGEVLSRFQDIGEIQDIISDTSISLVLDSIMLIAGGFILASINLQLFFLVLLLAFAYAVVVLIYRKPIAKVSRDVMENDAQVTSVLKESIDGIETIKSFHGEEQYYNKIEKKTKVFIRNLFKGSLINVSQSGLLTIVEGIGMVLVLWLGSSFVMKGLLSLGTLIAFESLIHFFLSPVQSLIGIQPEMQRALIAAERLNDVLEIADEESIHVGKSELESFKNKEIVLENVFFSYGYREDILKGISLGIQPGEKIAIIGESGCGKTTLLHLLASFYPVRHGELRLGENNFNDISLKYLREKIAYVSQNSTLFSGSIKDNILFGKTEYNEEKLQEVIEGCRVKEIIDKLPFGLDTMTNESGKNLSGGQKQRIALARALLSQPDILLLDESTSHLDLHTENLVLNFIEHWCQNTICIFAAHKDNVIKRCERIVFMKEGSIAGVGTHQELLQKSKDYVEFTKEGK